MSNSAGAGETSFVTTFFKACREFNDVLTHAVKSNMRSGWKHWQVLMHVSNLRFFA
jgi:hypothetical protein